MDGIVGRFVPEEASQQLAPSKPPPNPPVSDAHKKWREYRAEQTRRAERWNSAEEQGKRLVRESQSRRKQKQDLPKESESASIVTLPYLAGAQALMYVSDPVWAAMRESPICLAGSDSVPPPAIPQFALKL